MMNRNNKRVENVSGSSCDKGKNTETPVNGGSSGSNPGLSNLNTEISGSNMPPSVTQSQKDAPGKFSGKNFKKWQEKMFLYLTMLGLAKFVNDDPPVVTGDEVHKLDANLTWKQNDAVCRAHILENLSDILRDVYQNKKTTKELWESLTKLYISGDIKAKKNLVNQFLRYTMVDSKTVVSQVDGLCLIVHELRALGMILPEAFLVATIIDKLSPSWNDFQCYLVHKHKDMRVGELFDRLRSQEEEREYLKEFSRSIQKKGKKVQIEKNLGPSGGISKRPRLVGKSHISADDIEDVIQDISDMEI